MKRDQQPLGIQGIASIVPESGVDTTALADALGVRLERHGTRLGFSSRSKRHPGQEASDLCIAAAEKLLGGGLLDPDTVDCVVVVTQNPDGYGIPHTASVLQRKLGLSERCATFDIGLGGSGYVYGLSIALSFMQANNRRCGLMFTADPSSRMIDESDPATALRYGDAATVTWLSDEPRWTVGAFDLGTAGTRGRSMEVRLDLGGRLYLNEAVLDEFALGYLPRSITSVLDINGLTIAQIDEVVIQQTSRGIVESVGALLAVPGKVKFHAADYGDTGSSSIPLILDRDIDSEAQRVLICGFGSGLSWGATVLTRAGLHKPRAS